MSAHTPAPWHQAPAPDESGIDISSGGYTIATAWSGIDLIEHPDEAVMHANARLICAAPDLLLAVRELVAAWDGTRDVIGPTITAKLARAEAAIATAEGVQ